MTTEETKDEILEFTAFITVLAEFTTVLAEHPTPEPTTEQLVRQSAYVFLSRWRRVKLGAAILFSALVGGA